MATGRQKLKEMSLYGHVRGQNAAAAPGWRGGDVSMTRRHPDDPEGRPLCRQSSDPLTHGSCRHSCDHGQQHRSTSYAAEATKYTDTFARFEVKGLLGN